MNGTLNLTVEEMERRSAIYELLSLPDPSDLCTPHGHRRGHRYLCEGDAVRCDELKHHLSLAYIEWRRQNVGQDCSCIVSLNGTPIVH